MSLSPLFTIDIDAAATITGTTSQSVSSWYSILRELRTVNHANLQPKGGTRFGYRQQGCAVCCAPDDTIVKH